MLALVVLALPVSGVCGDNEELLTEPVQVEPVVAPPRPVVFARRITEHEKTCQHEALPYLGMTLSISPQGHVVGVTHRVVGDFGAKRIEAIIADVLTYRFKPFLVDGRLLALSLPHHVVIADNEVVHCYEAPLFRERRIDHLDLGEFPAGTDGQ